MSILLFCEYNFHKPHVVRIQSRVISYKRDDILLYDHLIYLNVVYAIGTYTVH